jgi:hypothetical protein
VVAVYEASLRLLSAYEVVVGFAAVHDYEPMIDVSWDGVRGCLAAEAIWLERAAQAASADGFDETLSVASDKEAGDDVDWLFRGLDVGVAGLVRALSAAGYATCYSCRGHAELASERVPHAFLGTETARLRLLVGYAGTVGCGVETDGDGLVTIYACSVVPPRAGEAGVRRACCVRCGRGTAVARKGFGGDGVWRGLRVG